MVDGQHAKLKNLIKHQMRISVDGLLYANSFNTLKKIKDQVAQKTANNQRERLNLINHILCSFADHAVLDWCKLFGSNGNDNNNQQVHWKRLFECEENIHATFSCNSDHYLNESQFREYIYLKDNLQKEEGSSEYYIDIDDLWNDIKNYRDKVVAHCDMDNLPPMPFIWPISKTLLKFSDFLYAIDQSHKFNLFELFGRKYTTARDLLTLDISQQLHEILLPKN